ncbi:hypothetical protein JNUCC0626_47810 [Lentzea sp. JNUCC 0626]|uniref:hypothetical protein n=1 Tax=Lentzea sp. JNUCC 0626 TaxID=3367513 RepID=UPI00374A2DDF
MNRKRAVLAGIVAATTASVGIVVLAAGPALAGPPPCNESDTANKACVVVIYNNTPVKSIRVNGRCLVGPSGYHGDVSVSVNGTPETKTYRGSKCEGNTQTSATVRWLGAGIDGYRQVKITN